MNKCVYVVLKSGREFRIDKFQYITYPGHGDEKTTKVEKFEEFYLYGKMLTFVGKNDIVSISSTDIEFIKFSGSFTE